MSYTKQNTIICDECGLFCRPYNEYTHLCKKCFLKVKNGWIKSFKSGGRNGDWQKSRAEVEAAEVCGLKWVGSNGVGILGTQLNKTMKYIPPKEPKVWSLKYADKKFGDYIRKRDKVCQRCGGKDRQLQCSHYWDRQWYATRFDPDNCWILCSWCHTFDKDNWEKDRLGEYRAYMIKKLGIKKFEELKAKHTKPIKRRNAILELMENYSRKINKK